MEAIKYRILSKGDIAESSGGLYNPGVLKKGDERIILVRHEKDYLFTNDVQATVIYGTLEDLKKGKYTIKTLKRKGFPEQTRIEDFRLFEYQNELFATCTFVFGWDGSSNSEPKSITPIICKVKIEEEQIILYDHLDLPLKRKRVEKNWMVFVWNENLYCVYSLDPLVIFQHKGFSWKLVKEEENGLLNVLKTRLSGSGFLSLSAITHWRDQYMLGFWHTYVNNIIKQGAFILDMATLDIVQFTEPIIDGEGWDDGYKKGICYVSGLVVNEETVEVWCGEADSHTSMLEFNKAELTDLLVRYPFKKQTPLKVCFRDAGLGDYICAMYAIQGWLDKNPDNSIVLYQRQHFELASVLRIPRVKIVQYTNQNAVVDLTSNEKESEYQEKLIFGDYKKWYSLKLGVEPKLPEYGEIKPKEGYEGCVVLAPYSHWDNRTYSIKYWKVISEMLVQQGYKVVIMDMHQNRCNGLSGEFYFERSLMDDFRLIKAASLVIANDSGVSHIAGLLGTKCIVLSGWMNPEAVYSMTDNDWIWNTTEKDSLRSLNKISPQDVITKVKNLEPLFKKDKAVS